MSEVSKGVYDVHIRVFKDHHPTKWRYKYRYKTYIDGVYFDSGYSRFKCQAIRYAKIGMKVYCEETVYDKHFELPK